MTCPKRASGSSEQLAWRLGHRGIPKAASSRRCARWSVLEEHLHKLAPKRGIDLRDERGRPESVDALGIELVKAQVIGEHGKHRFGIS